MKENDKIFKLYTESLNNTSANANFIKQVEEEAAQLLMKQYNCTKEELLNKMQEDEDIHDEYQQTQMNLAEYYGVSNTEFDMMLNNVV